MRHSLVSLAVALAVACAGCLPRAGTSPRAPKRPRRSVSVTVYSAPPPEENELLPLGGPGGAGIYDEDEMEQRRRERERRRVAEQMRIFARLSAADPDVRPYGVGIVKDERVIELPAGRSEYRFTDVARYIEPETVHFACLSPRRRGNVEVLEQSFEYDMLTAGAMLEKRLGGTMTVELESGARISGRLLCGGSDRYDLVLRTAPDEVEIARYWPGIKRMLFPEPPEGLVTKPTLAWLLETKRGGPKRVSVAYRTRGIVWEAGYTAVLSADGRAISLSGVATIANASGARYEDARLKLVAGEVNLVEPMELLDEATPGLCLISVEEPPPDAIDAGFEEKRFFEYHMYTLGRRCTIGNNEVKQIELFEPAARVPVEKSYVYCGLRFPRSECGIELHADREPSGKANSKVDVLLTFTNDEAAGLGMPLPAGPVRFLQRDPADGEPEFVGEAEIDHTPKDEEVTARLGSAFDLVGSRRQAGFRCEYNERWMEETVEIALRNHKDEPVEVEVTETMYRWLNWEITDCSWDGWREKLSPSTKARTGLVPEWHRLIVGNAGRETIGFEFVDTPIREALAFLGKLTRTDIRVDPDVGDPGAPVTLTVENLYIPKAVDAVARRAELWVGLAEVEGRIAVLVTPRRERLFSDYRASGERGPDWHRVLLASAPRRSVTAEFVATPLREALEFLGKSTGARIEIGRGIDRSHLDTPVTLNVTDMFAPLVLTWILELAELDCYASAGRIFVTTRGEVRERSLQTLEYEVSALSTSPARVAEMIFGHVRPDSWAGELGTSIEQRGGRLVVRQTLAVHEEIGAFLADMRRKLDSRTVVFPVTVPANGEKKLNYTVRYTW